MLQGAIYTAGHAPLTPDADTGKKEEEGACPSPCLSLAAPVSVAQLCFFLCQVAPASWGLPRPLNQPPGGPTVAPALVGQCLEAGVATQFSGSRPAEQLCPPQKSGITLGIPLLGFNAEWPALWVAVASRSNTSCKVVLSPFCSLQVSLLNHN